MSARFSCGSASTASFDKTHVIVSGTGYGGYLALAALVNYGERLRGAVRFRRHHGLHRLHGRDSARIAQNRGARGFGDERDADMPRCICGASRR